MADFTPKSTPQYIQNSNHTHKIVQIIIEGD